MQILNIILKEAVYRSKIFMRQIFILIVSKIIKHILMVAVYMLFKLI